MTRRTFTLQLKITVEDTGTGYSAEDMAEDIRDTVYTAVRDETPAGLDTVAMWLTALPEAPEVPERPADMCAGRGGTGDPRCGRAYGHSGPCDWTD